MSGTVKRTAKESAAANVPNPNLDDPDQDAPVVSEHRSDSETTLGRQERLVMADNLNSFLHRTDRTPRRWERRRP
jgi:hypothetical protein